MPHLAFRLPIDDLAQLRAIAELRRMSVSELLRSAVRRVVADALTEATGKLQRGASRSAVEAPVRSGTAASPTGSPRTGTELRAWRRERKWTQAKLADAIGVSRRTVNGVERSGDDPLTSTVLRGLAEAGRRTEE